MQNTPILYSFRRCPYAMRARLGLFVSDIQFEWREILLRDKPAEFLKISTDGTVPVMQVDEEIIQESRDIFLWALQGNQLMKNFDADIVERNDGEFKTALDQYKYASRHGEGVGDVARNDGSKFIQELEKILGGNPFLHGNDIGATDLAILPFIRQFAHVDQDWFYAQNWPNVIKWLDNFKNSELFKAMMIKIPPWKNDDEPRIYGQKPSNF